jgi:hypothetical protein
MVVANRGPASASDTTPVMTATVRGALSLSRFHTVSRTAAATRRLELPVADCADHPDHCEPGLVIGRVQLGDPEAFADGVLSWPRVFGQRFGHNHDSRLSLDVPVREHPAPLHDDSHRPEVVGADGLQVGHGVSARFSVGLSLRGERKVPASRARQRADADGRGGVDSGQRLHATKDLLIERAPARSVGIAGPRAPTSRLPGRVPARTPGGLAGAPRTNGRAGRLPRAGPAPPRPGTRPASNGIGRVRRQCATPGRRRSSTGPRRAARPSVPSSAARPGRARS